MPAWPQPRLRPLPTPGPTAPCKNLNALIAAAKAKPTSIHYATFGSGSGPHLTGALLEQAAGIQLQDVPYRGSSQSLIALMGGAAALSLSGVLLPVGHVIAGTIWTLFHILVITLQAFIFMMLALIYLGQAHNAH